MSSYCLKHLPSKNNWYKKWELCVVAAQAVKQRSWIILFAMKNEGDKCEAIIPIFIHTLLIPQLPREEMQQTAS